MYIYFKDVNVENIRTHLAYHADLWEEELV